ncbi:hypothetical protein HDR58_04790 [bacterium]|nr:hypothetical protein [bacterium]
MEFKFNESTMLELKRNADTEANSYMILSKAADVDELEMQNVIQIIDETGEEVTCTYDKFVEIFDNHGLAGFIL